MVQSLLYFALYARLYSISSSAIFCIKFCYFLYQQRWKQLLEGGSSSVSNRCPHHPFPRELSCTLILHSFCHHQKNLIFLPEMCEMDLSQHFFLHVYSLMLDPIIKAGLPHHLSFIFKIICVVQKIYISYLANKNIRHV